jgi:hypothetical protein
MNKLLRPSVVIPLTLSAAVLAALLDFSHPAQVVAVMEGLQPIYLLYVLVLMVAYEALRWAQWSVLLAALGIRAPLRTQVFTFLRGEVAESLPVGTYFRNYLLHSSTGTDFGLSSAATTVSMVTEGMGGGRRALHGYQRTSVVAAPMGHAELSLMRFDSENR